jgi:hypothetical protein
VVTRKVSTQSMAAVAIAGGTPEVGNPCIEITPTPAQYEQLCRDLKKLRRLGAASNTAAIIEAVRGAAEGSSIGRPENGRGERLGAPRSRDRR